MELINKCILPIHVVAGFISLVLFWLPIAVKKGGNLHIKIGWAYVYSMWMVVSTAFALSIINLIQHDYFSALFLGYLTVITSMPLWYGISILKYKKGITPALFNRRKWLYMGIVIFGTVNVLYAIITQFADGALLLFMFGILGMTDINRVRETYDNYQKSVNPIMEHISGMLVTGIAAYTAFFAFGGRTWLGEIFAGQLMIIPWVAPTVMAVIGIKWYEKRWTVRKV